MLRPTWKGHISFGLVNIPIILYPMIVTTSLHFHLLDNRNKARIRYERINEETGEEVPWNETVKAFEYDDGNYIIMKEEELKVESTQTINIENFISAKDLDCMYFEKPYYVVPDKKADKGYLLLIEALKNTHTIGIAKVVIHTRQYLTALMPYKNWLVLNLLYFYQELRALSDFNLPANLLKKTKVTPKELQIAEKLITSMTVKWDPKNYQDDFRENLMLWIKRKIKTGKTIASKEKPSKGKSGEVIDFMKLLQKSLKEKPKNNSIKPKKLSPHKKVKTRFK